MIHGIFDEFSPFRAIFDDFSVNFRDITMISRTKIKNLQRNAQWSDCDKNTKSCHLLKRIFGLGSSNFSNYNTSTSTILKLRRRLVWKNITSLFEVCWLFGCFWKCRTFERSTYHVHTHLNRRHARFYCGHSIAITSHLNELSRLSTILLLFICV